MKQHITKKQWNELNKDQQNALYVKVGPEVWGNRVIINIGQMIEFLESKHSVKCDQWMDEWKSWRVGLDWLDGEEYVYVVEKPELCDALWEAVKYVFSPERN